LTEETATLAAKKWPEHFSSIWQIKITDS
jgi:hypothetical protein